MASIPNLNFAKWSQGTENEKAEFVKELGRRLYRYRFYNYPQPRIW